MGPWGQGCGQTNPPPNSQDTEVNTVVIPEMELQAKDLDKNDILFYTLQEVTLVSNPIPCPTLTPPSRRPILSAPLWVSAQWPHLPRVPVAYSPWWV